MIASLTIVLGTMAAIALFLGHGLREILRRRGDLKRGGSGYGQA